MNIRETASCLAKHVMSQVENPDNPATRSVVLVFLITIWCDVLLLVTVLTPLRVNHNSVYRTMLSGPTAREYRQQRQKRLEKREEKQDGVVSADCLRWHLGADVSDSVASGAQTQTAQKNGS